MPLINKVTTPDASLTAEASDSEGSEQSPLSPPSSFSPSPSAANVSKSYVRKPIQYGSINADPGELNSRNAAVLSRYKYYSRLAPHSSSALLIPDHVVPSEFWSSLPLVPEGKQNSLITIFSIWNTMMGTSLLSMPWAVGQAGFALGLFLMIFIAFLSLYTSYRVVKSVGTIAHQGGEIMEFSDVCRHFLGRPGEICAVVFSVVTLLGGAIVYWILMSNFLFNSVLFIHNEVKSGTHVYPDLLNYTEYHDDYIHCTAKPVSHNSFHSLRYMSESTNVTTATPPTDDPFNTYWDIQKTVPFFLLIVLVPLINFKSPTFFTKFNALGTISVLYLLGFSTYKAIAWGFHMDFSKIDGSYVSLSFPALTGVLSLAYFIHNCILSIVRNQAKPENNARDLTIAFVCVAITYTFVGCLMYAAWPMISKKCIDQNILNNFLPEDPLAFVARIFLFIQMITVFPLLLYIMRIQVMHVLFGSVWPSWKHVVVLNIIVVGICLIFARFFPKIGSIIRYTGAASGLVYAFFLPCVTHLLSERKHGRLTYLKLIVHIVLIGIGLANFIAQFLIS